MSKAAKTTKAKATKKAKAFKKTEMKAGTVLKRTYKGKEYEVRATAEGYRMDGKDYASLTEVAKTITQYPSISGPQFFGLTRPSGNGAKE